MQFYHICYIGYVFVVQLFFLREKNKCRSLKNLRIKYDTLV